MVLPNLLEQHPGLLEYIWIYMVATVLFWGGVRKVRRKVGWAALAKTGEYETAGESPRGGQGFQGSRISDPRGRRIHMGCAHCRRPRRRSPTSHTLRGVTRGNFLNSHLSSKLDSHYNSHLTSKLNSRLKLLRASILSSHFF